MTENNLTQLGSKLKARRKQLGYTQEFAAEKANISYSYYTKIENGVQAPSLEVAVTLAAAFNLSLDKWLMADSYRLTEASPEYNELIKCMKSLKTDNMEATVLLLKKLIACFSI